MTLTIRPVTFEVTQAIRSWYLNVTDGQRDGRTDGPLTIAIPSFALRASRGETSLVGVRRLTDVRWR